MRKLNPGLSFIMAYLLPILVMAQEGDYFYTHFDTENEQIDNANFEIAQDQHGIMCMANRAGVLRFDGVNWEIIATPGATFSLAIDSLNTLYVGGRFGFGYLERDENFDLTFHALSDSMRSSQDIFEVVLAKDKVYFLNQKNVFVYDGKNTTSVGLKNASSFVALSVFNDELVLSTDGGNTYQLADSALVSRSDLPNGDAPVLFIESSPSGEKHLLGTIDNSLYLHQGNSWLPLVVDDDNYMAESEIVAASWINDNLLAVATLDGGVVFVDIDAKKVSQIINYRSGLPDNEVLAMGLDQDRGLWVAHEFGFTRITPELAFRRFGTFPGLDGSLSSVLNHQGKLYVATSVGVFFLDEVKDYDEVTYFVKQQTSSKSTPQKATRTTTQDQPKRKKGVLGFLKKNRKDQNTTTPAPTEEKKGFLSNMFKKSDPKSRVERRTRRELKSIRYQYTKIEGADSKTTQLLTVNGKLLAAGLGGIVEINDTQVTQIIEDPVRYMYHSDGSNLLVATTVLDEVLVFRYQDARWRPLGVVLGIEDLVQHIAEDQQGNFWLVGSDVVFQVIRNNNGLALEKEFDFENPFFENTYSFEHEGSIRFVNSTGYFSVDDNKGAIVSDQKLLTDLGKPSQYLRGGNGSVWSFNGEKWGEIGAEVKEGVELLNVFNDINFIANDRSGLWVIDGSNGLVKFSLEQYQRLNSHHAVYLKEVRIGSRKIKPENKLRISQQESSVSFNFIQPDFAGVFKFEYQYRLEGLREQWSGWSFSNRVIDFPYLPDGRYALHVQTKDVFGQVVSIEPMEFVVVPPYWKQPWFYALEVLLFGALFVLSFRLNRIDHKYRILSRLLAFMTLIITVEFVQTLAENRFETDSSPVVEFFIQVSIAFLILPIEVILRKAFFKGSESSLAPEAASAKTKISKAKAGN